ncbi:hypothetical protein SSS_07488 [Sarcoptes scabiei]|nr:hypothetical protein SSS_07488 [Sarcoptes scabiei]
MTLLNSFLILGGLIGSSWNRPFDGVTASSSSSSFGFPFKRNDYGSRRNKRKLLDNQRNNRYSPYNHNKYHDSIKPIDDLQSLMSTIHQQTSSSFDREKDFPNFSIIKLKDLQQHHHPRPHLQQSIFTDDDIVGNVVLNDQLIVPRSSSTSLIRRRQDDYSNDDDSVIIENDLVECLRSNQCSKNHRISSKSISKIGRNVFGLLKNDANSVQKVRNPFNLNFPMSENLYKKPAANKDIATKID